ncbi:MAG: hypothetical protein HYW07_08915 [Candidatus Latescibacteria bacterium]|nr:hypothetical protein [Candidatus Latescibacterota bacterium]
MPSAMSSLQRFSTWCAHAFAVEGPREEPDPREREVAARLARFVVRRQLLTPALMLLESGRPLNFIGSQMLAFLAPFATLIFASEEYEVLVRLLERRRGIDLLIEALAAEEQTGRGGS